MHDGLDDKQDKSSLNHRLSYKFQRLRERLREAIRTGELDGKLPGERQLAKKFRVNAKTLSKALTDLAAEGLLDRAIGRGTYVRSERDTPVSRSGAWLLIVDDPTQTHFLHDSLAEFNPHLRVVSSKQALRPSDLTGVTGVVDVAIDTPDDTIRDLLLRNIPAVVVMRQPTGFSTHTVAIDRMLGAANLARELALLGHRRFFIAEARSGLPAVHDVVRQIVLRYDGNAVVHHGFGADVPAAIENGVTAVIAACTFEAGDVMNKLAGIRATVPQDVSVGCAGAVMDEVPCSGYFVPVRQFAESIAKVIRDHVSSRPVNLWLAGAYHERQTLSSPRFFASDGAQPGIGAARPIYDGPAA